MSTNNYKLERLITACLMLNSDEMRHLRLVLAGAPPRVYTGPRSMLSSTETNGVASSDIREGDAVQVIAYDDGSLEVCLPDPIGDEAKSLAEDVGNMSVEEQSYVLGYIAAQPGYDNAAYKRGVDDASKAHSDC